LSGQLNIESSQAVGIGIWANHVRYGQAMAVDVSPVRGFSDLREFVALPFRLHAGTPWIPPLKLERYLFLNRRLNAYFSHAEAEYFLARRHGRVVGRITAQIDAAFNEFHDSRWGMFGFLEFEDDPEVLAALLDVTAGWLGSRRCERMVGPMDFQMNDERGVLIEGYDREPMIKQPWHPPYYRELCERAGLEKAMDLFMWELHISGRENVLPVIWELVAPESTAIPAALAATGSDAMTATIQPNAVAISRRPGPGQVSAGAEERTRSTC